MIIAILFLGMFPFGAPVTFGTGFALGMNVADAHGVGSASYTVWAGVLALHSLRLAERHGRLLVHLKQPEWFDIWQPSEDPAIAQSRLNTDKS